MKFIVIFVLGIVAAFVGSGLLYFYNHPDRVSNKAVIVEQNQESSPPAPNTNEVAPPAKRSAVYISSISGETMFVGREFKIYGHDFTSTGNSIKFGAGFIN